MIKSSLHFYTTVPLRRTHTHTDTQPSQHLSLDPKKGGDGSGKGFHRGGCFNSKRVRKEAPLAKKSTGLFALPEESAGMMRRSLMERNNH